jgi:hypothetical protein
MVEPLIKQSWTARILAMIVDGEGYLSGLTSGLVNISGCCDLFQAFDLVTYRVGNASFQVSVVL